MKLILQGKPKKSFIVYSVIPRKVGEPVEVIKDGRVVQTGEVVKDMSTVKKYQDAKKRIGDKDVLFNSGKGYYKVKLT